MQNNKTQAQQCHVCQHLGQNQCRYTSHKKYRNQKGNQSFRVGTYSWSSTQKKIESSYYKNLQQTKISLQISSQILPSSSLQARQQQNDQSPIRFFERNLIEKVIENRTPQQGTKDQLKDTSGNLEKFIFQSEENFKSYSPVNKVAEPIVAQITNLKKRPMGFLRYHQNSVHNVDYLNLNKQKQQQKPDNQPVQEEQKPSSFAENYLNSLQARRSKYHFDYGQKDFALSSNTKPQISNIKNASLQNSFHVDDPRVSAHDSQMLISRANEKERSSFYAGNLFKDGSVIREERRSQQSSHRPSEFNNESHEHSIIENLQLKYTREKRQSNQLSDRSNLNKSAQKIGVKFVQPSRQLPRQPSTSIYRPMNKSNIEPFALSKQSFSTQQQNAQSRIVDEKSYQLSPNNTAQQNSSNRRVYFPQPEIGYQRLFYPIYPIYQVVYQRVEVVAGHQDNLSAASIINHPQRL